MTLLTDPVAEATPSLVPDGLARVRHDLTEWLAGLDHESVLPARARQLRDELIAVARAADAAVVVLAGQVAAAEPGGPGAAAKELGRAVGVSMVEAERMLGASRALGRCPGLRGALVDGRLSSAQAGLVAEAASVSPSSEGRLVRVATEQDLAGLRREVERVKASAGDEEAKRKRAQAERSCRSWTANGRWHMSVSGPVPAGAEVSLAHRLFLDDALAAARAAGRREPFGAVAFDALVDMANAGAAHVQGQPLATSASSGHPDPSPAPDADRLGGVPPRTGDQAAAAGTESADGSAPPSAWGSTPGDHSASTAPAESGPPSASRSTQDGRSASTVPAGSGPSSASGSTQDGHGASTAPFEPAEAPPGAPLPRSGPPGAGQDPVPPAGTSLPVGATGRLGLPHQPVVPKPEDSVPRAVVQPRSRRRRRWQAIIRVDASALARGHAIAGEACEIAGVGPIDVAAATDLLGHATVHHLVTNGRDVRTIATSTRYIPTQLGLAVAERSAFECANRACSNHGWLEIDHNDPYAKTHDTSYENLHALCTACHSLKTHRHHRITIHPDHTVTLTAPEEPDPP